MNKIKILLLQGLLFLPALVWAGHGGGHACGAGACGGGKTFAIFGYLLALALGYWVLHKASSDKAGWVRKAGYLAGIVIFLAGLGGLVCKTVKCIRDCKAGYGMGSHCELPLYGGMDDEDEDEDDKEVVVEKKIIQKKGR